MKLFVLWKKIENGYIYGTMSNFKKELIGWIDAYGNERYYSQYDDYEDISDDYEPEQEPAPRQLPNGKQNINGADWNRYQQRKHFKTLRENLNNSSNPEYTRPQAKPQSNDFQTRNRLNSEIVLNKSALNGVVAFPTLPKDDVLIPGIDRDLNGTGYGMMDNDIDEINVQDFEDDTILSKTVQHKLLNFAKTSANVQGAIKRGETVFVRQYFIVSMDYKLGENQRIEIFETEYIMIHKGEEGKGATYFIQVGRIKENGDLSNPLGGMSYAEFEKFNASYGNIEKIPINAQPSNLNVSVVMPIAQPAKILPLPSFFKPKPQVPPHIRVNVRNPLPVQFSQNNDAITNRNTVTNRILSDIAKNLRENPNLIINIIGNSNYTQGINVRTFNTIRGVRNVPGTIRDLMLARARAIERILINEYGVNHNQIRVQVGSNNTSQTTQFIYRTK